MSDLLTAIVIIVVLILVNAFLAASEIAIAAHGPPIRALAVQQREAMFGHRVGRVLVRVETAPRGRAE